MHDCLVGTVSISFSSLGFSDDMTNHHDFHQNYRSGNCASLVCVLQVGVECFSATHRNSNRKFSENVASYVSLSSYGYQSSRYILNSGIYDSYSDGDSDSSDVSTKIWDKFLSLASFNKETLTGKLFENKFFSQNEL